MNERDTSMTHQQNETPSVSRRDFLKHSTATASLAGAASLAIGRSVHAAGSDTIKIGMIGSGGRGSGAAAQALKAGPDVKLVAMCDVFDDRVQAARQNLIKLYPEQVAVDDDHCFVGFDGYQKVIDSVDVVLIACASKFHPMYSEAAIKAGKHVFVEKPHAIDPVGIRRVQAVCELAKKKGLSLVSGLQSRYSVAWQETVKRIHDGEIGDIVAMQSMFLRAPYRVYERPEGMDETEYHFYNWYHLRWLSGDDVPQSLVHNVDRMSWILHEVMPRSCFSLAGRSSSFGMEYGDMFDHDTVIYEYESGTRLYALCRTQTGCYKNSSDIIMGSKGICHLDKRRPHFESNGETYWRYEGKPNNPYVAEQAALIESVRTGKPINSGYHMVGSTMIGVMGQMAAYTGKTVEWDKAYNSDLQYGPSPEESSFEIDPPTAPDATGNYPIPKPGLTRLI